VAELVRTRWIALFGAGAAAVCLGSFTASFIWLNRSPAPIYCTGHEPYVPTGRPAIQSPLEFDLHLDKSEHRYGITKLRRKLGAEARGHVLEVAMGAGRNLEFYDWGKLIQKFVTKGERNKDLLEKSGWGRSRIEEVKEMESFTGVDISDSMLDLGLKRVRSVVPHGTEILPVKKPVFAELAKVEEGRWCLSMLQGQFRILKGDAQNELPSPKAEAAGKYDTVIQTFGLCSVRDPTRLLENMAHVVRPETGRIILLEHGRSWWDLVNGLLDRSAKGHFERFGCWWNRDIEMIVEDAQSKIPGLEVVEIKRPGWFKFGTHFWIELRVREVERAKGENAAKPASEQEAHGSSWWNIGSSILTSKPNGDGEKKD
jgi:methyltransferase OMS1